MIKFNKVILHNFGSYGHAEVDLADRGFCMVSGENHYKKDNSLSNGSGKSMIWDAIVFCLTGETLRGVKSGLKNINIDEKDCYITLDFLFNRDHYVLKRIIEPKTDLKIEKNGVDASGKGIRESEKKLGELLPDITKDYIASTVILGQGMPNKFSSFSPSGRKELLETLTKSDFMIEDIKNRVVTRQTELNSKVREMEDSLLVNNTKLNSDKALLKQKTDEKANFKIPNYQNDINSITAWQKAKTAELTKLESEATTLNESLSKANAESLSIGKEKSAKEELELNAYNEAKQKDETELAELKATNKSLAKEINRLESITDICPTCHQHIPGKQKPDTTEQHKQFEENEAKIEKLSSELSSFYNQHLQFKKQINEEFDKLLTEANSHYNNLMTQSNKNNRARNDARQLLAQYENEKNKLIYERDNVDAYLAKLDKDIVSLNDSIAQYNNLITIAQNGKNDLDQHIAVLKKIESLVKRDFRGYLLQNIVSYIDKKAKDYSEIVFGTRELNVYLDGNALDISYCNKIIDNLSGGEKQRVDLILQFAIRDMLNTYLNETSNILVLDEITDFLDKKSCDAVMNLVSKELNTVESVFIVSHHSDELDIISDSELKVVKNEDGISEIVG